MPIDTGDIRTKGQTRVAGGIAGNAHQIDVRSCQCRATCDTGISGKVKSVGTAGAVGGGIEAIPTNWTASPAIDDAGVSAIGTRGSTGFIV